MYIKQSVGTGLPSAGRSFRFGTIALRAQEWLLSADVMGLKWLAVGVLAIQSALALVAAATLLMLHGDGAYFVYALSAGAPWALKWRDIADRASVYAFTVEPTALLAELFDLGPRAIAAWNGFIFYAFPALLFAIACSLVWRKNPKYLIFPIATYVLGSSLGYGFPSELLLAPGFLWIALFLVLNDRIGVGFLLAMAGLMFSHELAVPSAVIAGCLAVMRVQQSGRRGHAMLVAGVLVLLAAVLVAVLVRGGAGGSSANTLYVLDPRRVLNCPTLWLVGTVLIGGLVVLRKKPALFAVALVMALVSAPLLAKVFPGLNFEQGRYDSARSVLAVLMFALAAIFAVRPRPQLATRRAPVASVLALALAASMSAAAVFVGEWQEALAVVTRIATPAGGASQTVELPGPLTPGELAAINRVEFTWVLPFETAVLADGQVPRRLIFDGSVDYGFYCQRAAAASPERIPAAVLVSMRAYACSHVPPPVDSLQRRVRAAIKQWLHH